MRAALGPEVRPSAGVAAAVRDARRRVLVGGIGYTNLRDMSAGPLLVERLGGPDWPAGVDVLDLSAGAVHIVHALQADEPYDAAIFVAAVRRGDPAGTVRCQPYVVPPAGDDEVQSRIAEAITGVIDLDVLLTILHHFDALPPRVTVIEIEPRDEDWGPAISAPVEAAFDVAAALVRREVREFLG